ncbi:F-box protein At1g11270-like [Cornus florida]|uniref:F-box protein At1g11270-like n=1 Tax=Cornus florida TaxID=4283 RepID=UPI00289EC164|nr:F-box protein At1g11270-like [Cornus florida]
MSHSKQSFLVSMESIKRGPMTNYGDTHRLPDDVMIDILARLPVKSVIQSRSVCKNWHSIVKNPSFVAKHFNHHTNSSRLFVYHFDYDSEEYFFSLYPDESLAGSPPAHQDVVVDMPRRLAISLYNGILCMYNLSNRFALWNPATREFRSLPVLPLDFPPNVVIEKEIFGFGFGLDPITNDYKVVWVWVTADEFIKKRWMAAVYTVSSDSWRYLDVSLPYTWMDPPLSNTCINGVYHWYAMDKEEHPLILSFDMGNELFHEIRGDLPSPQPAAITTYNNSLALCYYDFPDVDIWVMMEDGSWTKHSTVVIPTTMLGFWKNGLLFMETDDPGHLGLYDPETDKVKDLGSRICAKPLVYRESLVAIRGRNGFIEQDQLSDVDQVLNFSN